MVRLTKNNVHNGYITIPAYVRNIRPEYKRAYLQIEDGNILRYYTDSTKSKYLGYDYLKEVIYNKTNIYYLSPIIYSKR